MLLDDETRGPSGEPEVSDTEALEHMQRWLRMTPLERLRAFER